MIILLHLIHPDITVLTLFTCPCNQFDGLNWNPLFQVPPSGYCDTEVIFPLILKDENSYGKLTGWAFHFTTRLINGLPQITILKWGTRYCRLTSWRIWLVGSSKGKGHHKVHFWPMKFVEKNSGKLETVWKMDKNNQKFRMSFLIKLFLFTK